MSKMVIRERLRTLGTGIARSRWITKCANLTRLLGPPGAILGVAAILLSSCASAAVETGIYVVRLPDGAPGWIGAPAGVPAWSPVGDAIAWGNEDGLFLTAEKTGV